MSNETQNGVYGCWAAYATLPPGEDDEDDDEDVEEEDGAALMMFLHSWIMEYLMCLERRVSASRVGGCSDARRGSSPLLGYDPPSSAQIVAAYRVTAGLAQRQLPRARPVTRGAAPTELTRSLCWKERS